MKSILLGTAAGMMVASGAYAADLPGEVAPVAVDYVKVCDAFGAGFFYIPGSDTCLQIGGRVRFQLTYNGTDGHHSQDTVNARADARVTWDARTATDYGTLRTFMEFGTDDSSRNIYVNQAFIQLGYVTVGRQDDVANGSGLYGINDATWGPGDYTATGITVLADNLGGGFYVGAGVYGNDNSVTRQDVWTEDKGADVHVSAAIGIADQPWGSFDVSGVYIHNNEVDPSYTFVGYPYLFGIFPVGFLPVFSYDAGSPELDTWGVKATADLKLMDPLDVRLWVGYTKVQDTDFDDTAIGVAAKYAVNDATNVYAGVRYDILDGDDNTYANVGVDYSLVKGLNLQGELDYNHYGDDNDFAVVGRVVRVW